MHVVNGVALPCAQQTIFYLISPMPTLTERLAPWIEDYQLQLPRWTHDEIYKWRAVKVFQDNWDLEATDFPAMLRRSLAATGNLLTSSMYYPKLMIERFSDQRPDDVREAFRHLFDEELPLLTRLRQFMNAAEIWRQEFVGAPANNSYQNQRTLMSYLTLHYPERYYLYKSEMYKDFAALVAAPFDNRHKAALTRVQDYITLAGQVRDVLAHTPALLSAHHERLTPEHYTDTELHLLTQDFIYCTVRASKEAAAEAAAEASDDDADSDDEPDDSGDETPDTAALVSEVPAAKPRWWVIGAGVGAYLWEDWKSEGVMSIGWDSLGDLRGYSSKEEIQEVLIAENDHTNRSNDALACWQFYKDVRIGDYMIVKRGRTVVEGVGRVTGPYDYDPSLDEFQHIRRVEWLLDGPWERTADVMFGTKTLTDVTGHKLVQLVQLELETPTQLHRIQTTGVGEDEIEGPIVLPPYTFAQASADLFMSDEALAGLLNSLKRKMNLVIQGPPGVGKSFVARRLAHLLLREADDARVQMVQFHPSYSYEDFIMGYRASGTGFVREAGVLLKFVRDVVIVNPGKDYVFIIDEMNRANLGKVLGECMLLLENDKRGPEHKVMLPYGGEYMYLPDNLYLIGTMNTADRSLALVDFALRRRFAFKRLQPELGERFASYMMEKHGLAADFVAQLVEAVSRLNAMVAADRTLGADFLIGHSYFSSGPQNAETPEAWYERVLEDEIGPQLEEYWIENPGLAQNARNLLNLVPVIAGTTDDE
jgi:5-methylcytosine-specific restriction protein B